jgi:CheY-specific phosphatase CheX
VAVSLADQGADLVVGASVTEETGLALAARMLQATPEDLPEDAATSALAEILNMVAGRVLHGLSNSGLRAQIGLPVIGAPKQPDHDAIMMGFEFEALNGEPKSFAFSITEKDSSAGAKTD